MSKRITIVIPDWASDEVEKYMAAQGSKGHSFVALILDTMKKYGCRDYLEVKLMNRDETDGEQDV